MSYFSQHRNRLLKPYKVRVLTALLLGELTQRQLSLMLSTHVRVIDIELQNARLHGLIRTSHFILRKSDQNRWIAYYTLTPKGHAIAKELICQS